MNTYAKSEIPEHLQQYFTAAELGSEPSPDCGGWAGRLNEETVYRIVLSSIRDREDDEFTARSLASVLASLSAKREPCGRCFVCNIVGVFRGVRRVLRDDGTVWLNLGDSYSSSGGHTTNEDYPGGIREGRANNGQRQGAKGTIPKGIPQGNLVGVPWRVALALQADGWILRQDIIWHKPAPMPESVRNRCTKAHEYVFLLVKKMDYFCDMEAIKEPANSYGRQHTTGVQPPKVEAMREAGYIGPGGDLSINYERQTANKRSVWSVSSQGYPGAHFATFPPKLIRPMILAGTSEAGACSGCGAPWERVVEKVGGVKIAGDSSDPSRQPFGSGLKPKDVSMLDSDDGYDGHRTRVGLRAMDAGKGRDRSFRESRNGVDATLDGEIPEVKTVGWAPTCECVTVEIGEDGDTEHLVPLPVVPCTVLDPFIGSGTTVAVAVEEGRRGVGIDLSEKYLTDNAVPRVRGALLGKAETAWLAGT